MKFFIEKVTYIPSAAPIIAIHWRANILKSSTCVDYYPWTNYPYEQNLEHFKPHYFYNRAGITLFKAPKEMTKQDILSHNTNNYESDPEEPTPKTRASLVERLEKAADEICNLSDSRYLYFMKNKNTRKVFTLQEVEIMQGIYSNDDSETKQKESIEYSQKQKMHQ
ncbi:hypothetical protein HRQ65_08110 [Tatlockia micdadei]|uniref:hypothetical protein n=1 Tax=Legionella micdadei TaxID=451 RepID=UPI00156D80CC|nr:hypothetical protein [Legionella micdadei]NSL18344.1 hypothetical protein [Legionella micdadei]